MLAGCRLAPGMLLFLLISPAAAQEPVRTFRTATRLVEVPVVVTDRGGRPVSGLTREDFTLLEDGVRQDISVFEVDDTREPPSRRGAPVGSAGFGAAAMFTNRAQDPSGSLVVVLLDRINAAFDSQRFARRHLEQYLLRMRGGDRVALYVVDGGIRVLHDFSSDRESLRRALDAYRARASGEYDASQEPPPDLGAEPGMPVWIVDPSTAVSDFYIRARTRSTFRSLQVLAQHLAGVDGRKTVVWISEAFGIPTGLNRAEFLEEMRKTQRALNDAQAALYPIDARGLVGAIRYGPRGAARFTTLESVRDNLETMEIMAGDTGGRAFGNTNALDVSIERAIDDGRLTYLLGYTPTDTRADGRFRTIAVKVRGRGLTVRSRRGYIAGETAADPLSRDAALKDALQAPLAATEVGLAADVVYEGPYRVRIDLRIDPATLTLQEQGGKLRGSVDVLVAEVTRQARGSVLRTEQLDLAITAGERAAVFREGVAISCTVPVTRALHELRILVRDASSGRLGSLVIPESRLARVR